MQEDYPELEKKELSVKYYANKTEECFVAGCNRAIGVTLLRLGSKGAKEDIVFCLNRKLHIGLIMTEEQYELQFDATIKAIEDGGLFDVEAMDNAIGYLKQACGSATCAFV